MNIEKDKINSDIDSIIDYVGPHFNKCYSELVEKYDGAYCNNVLTNVLIQMLCSLIIQKAKYPAEMAIDVSENIVSNIKLKLKDNKDECISDIEL